MRHSMHTPGSALCGSLGNDDCLILLALQHLEGFSARALRQLLALAASPSECLDMAVDASLLDLLTPASRRALLNFRRAPRASRAWEIARRSADWLEGVGAKLLPYFDTEFPQSLIELTDCPPFLVTLGNTESVFKKPMVTIVGTRKPTVLGADIAYRLAAEMGKAGFTIVSGMATGIDSAAHQGALSAQAATAAVWATGMDRVYPASARSLANEIAQQGLILTEMPLGTLPHKGHFVKRNRIVAGLSRATVVVEAEQKSGSLITAQLALDLNREVAAVPGAVTSRKSAGCHQLIKQGAALIENSQDVIDLLGGMRSLSVEANQFEALVAELNKEQQLVLAVLDAEPLPAEILQVRTGLDIETLNQVLIDLELQGLLLNTLGTYQRRS